MILLLPTLCVETHLRGANNGTLGRLTAVDAILQEMNNEQRIVNN